MPCGASRFLKANIAVLALCAVVLFIVFVLERYGWDIDHEMYYGQRLLHGELLWTREFHDKLPFVQLIFTIPAFFGQAKLFGLLATTCVVAAGAAIHWLVPRIVSLPETDTVPPALFTLLCALLYFDLMFFFSAMTINVLATSLSVIAILLLFYASARPENRLSKMLAAALFGSFCAAASISIRPYFFPPLAITVLAAALLPLARSNSASLFRIKLARPFLFLMLWGGLIGAWGLAMNVLPYAVSGQLDAFADGLSMLLTDLTPVSAADGFISALALDSWGFLKSPSFLIYSAFAALFAAYGLTRRSTRDAAYYCDTLLIALFALISYVFAQHYWTHYIQLFFGQFVLFLAFLLPALLRNGSGSRRAGVIRLLTMIWLQAMVALVAVCTLWKAALLVSVGGQHPSAEKLQLVAGYLARNPGPERSFLFLKDMYVHWKLDEARHGFPHAANTQHVVDGWWRKAGPHRHFQAPTDRDQYCALLQVHGPALIFGATDKDLLPCLVGRTSSYYPVATLRSKSGETVLVLRRS